MLPEPDKRISPIALATDHWKPIQVDGLNRIGPAGQTIKALTHPVWLVFNLIVGGDTPDKLACRRKYDAVPQILRDIPVVQLECRTKLAASDAGNLSCVLHFVQHRLQSIQALVTRIRGIYDYVPQRRITGGKICIGGNIDASPLIGPLGSEQSGS
jgi:hypothetical protein